jgi:ketosteroid isomerase-like protein
MWSRQAVAAMQARNQAWIKRFSLEHGPYRWDLAAAAEEADVVVAEGSVRTQRREGDRLNLRFCDVFVMKAGKIQHLTSYLMEIK